MPVLLWYQECLSYSYIQTAYVIMIFVKNRKNWVICAYLISIYRVPTLLQYVECLLYYNLPLYPASASLRSLRQQNLFEALIQHFPLIDWTHPFSHAIMNSYSSQTNSIQFSLIYRTVILSWRFLALFMHIGKTAKSGSKFF